MVGTWEIDVHAIEKVQDNNMTNLRRFRQTAGTWEGDTNALTRLGISYTHFIFDQNQLHDIGMKKSQSVEKSILHFRICLFCRKKKCFFSRGDNCEKHL